MAAGCVYSHVHHVCYVHVLVLLMPVCMSVFRMIWSFPRPSYIGSALLQVRVCFTTYTRTRDERITWHILLFISIKAAVFFSYILCWMSRSPFHCWWIRKPLRDLVGSRGTYHIPISIRLAGSFVSIYLKVFSLSKPLIMILKTYYCVMSLIYIYILKSTICT